MGSLPTMPSLVKVRWFMTSYPLNVWHVIFAVVAIVALRIPVSAARRRFKTTRLRGPPRSSFIYGTAKDTEESSDTGYMYEAWIKDYGAVFEVPVALGRSTIMLFDPKALQHYCARETWTYIALPSSRTAFKRNMGKGVIWAIGEDHRRQRKSLTPAFSHAAIRNLTPIYYNCAYKAKAAWEAIIDAGGGSGAVIEVQKWMNHISLDTIGLACFSHDFGSLDGKPASITAAFDAPADSPTRSARHAGYFVLNQVLPILAHLPTARYKLFRNIRRTLSEICKELLAKTREEKEAGILEGKGDRSIIRLLIQAADAHGSLRLSQEEIMAQMNVLLIAGYETTSISLTWALLELARNTDIQTKLREELLAFAGDPTYDQFSNGLPYLDAVVHETLRLRSPVTELTRIATEDDVIPLSEPVRTRSGKVVDSISVAKGTHIRISIPCINRSNSIWGPDAKEFRPERWLEEDGIPKKAQEIQAYRHILTFSDGPRTCLGKGFAVAEFKAVLIVLIKNFVFELREGSNEVELTWGIFRRPKIAGEVGARVPLYVRRYEG
ncbi:hypothetical protein ID866_8607 [Astraeus odoratus]|nr:hypothetical protein ID866_8607 [Astraeus odoratus]